MKKSILFLFCFLLAAVLFAQPGTIDHTFNPGDLGFGHGDGANGKVYEMVEQPDERILIYGNFTTYNGISRNRIARINPDGSLDQSFDPGTGFEGFYNQSYILKIILQTDGRILVGGKFDNYNGYGVNNLIRLNADGSRDVTFDTGLGPDDEVWAISLQPDGKILIGGSFLNYNGVQSNNTARLHPDGSFDTSFQGPVFESFTGLRAIKVLPDDKILIGGGFKVQNFEGNNQLVRLMPDGSVDTTFSAGLKWGMFIPFGTPYVSNICITEDNRYLITGQLLFTDDLEPSVILRLNADGSVDKDFHIPYVYVSWDYPQINALFPTNDGKFIIRGYFHEYDNIPRSHFARIHSNGTLDPAFFDSDYGYSFSAFLEQENGKLIIGGNFNRFEGINQSRNLVRADTDGNLDMSFNPSTGANRLISASTVQTDGKIVIGGNSHFYNNGFRKGLARIYPNGALDASFDPGNGITGFDHLVSAIDIQPDGKILAGGTFISFDDISVGRIVRLNSNGSYDPTFQTGSGSAGIVFDLKVTGDGSILVAGTIYSFNEQPAGHIIRLFGDGSRDTGFAAEGGANSTVRAIAVQPDDKIMVGGHFTMFNGEPINRIARLNADGSLDHTFNTGFGVGDGNVSIIVLQPDGKALIGGSFEMVDSISRRNIARLNSDGSLDTAFDPGFGANDMITDVFVQPDGKIVIGGRFTMYDSVVVNHIARLHPDGSLDTTFIMGEGFNNPVYTLLLLDDGDIIAGGDFTAYDGTGRNRLARIKGGEPEGTGRIFSQNGWQVFPNPATERITVKNNQGAEMTGLRLFDLHGRVLSQIPDLRSGRIELKTGDIPAGVYILEILESNTVTRIKILKQ